MYVHVFLFLLLMLSNSSKCMCVWSVYNKLGCEFTLLVSSHFQSGSNLGGGGLGEHLHSPQSLTKRISKLLCHIHEFVCYCMCMNVYVWRVT